MKRLARGIGAAALVVGVVSVPPARSEAEDSANFSAEVFAAPSYHMSEIPKVEEGGEGFSWAYVNQTPESWGRSFAFWLGPTAETTFATSAPQVGPLEGHRWRAPGAWMSYAPGGETRGEANFGDPAVLPLGTSAQTPGGNLDILLLRGHAEERSGTGEAALANLEAAAAPVRIGAARSLAHAERVDGAAVSTGEAVVRDVVLGDVRIDEIRSEASVHASAAGDQASWKLTILGLSTPDQTWNNLTFSSTEKGDERIQEINKAFADGAPQLRSEFVIVPGRIFKDAEGTHAVSGFLRMAHSPVITENSLFQKMGYAFSYTSARAIWVAGSASGAEPPTDAGSANDIEIGDGGSSGSSSVTPPPVALPPAASAAPTEPARFDPVSSLPPLMPARSFPGSFGSYALPADNGAASFEVTAPADVSAALPAPTSRAAPTGPRQVVMAPATLQALGISVGEEAGREASRVMGGLALLGVVAVLVAVDVGRRQMLLVALQRKPR